MQWPWLKQRNGYRTIWKTIKPHFANKIKVKTKITLNEDGKSTKDDKDGLKFLSLSLWILHLALRYPTIDHYLKKEIFQKLCSMQLKALKMIVV